MGTLVAEGFGMAWLGATAAGYAEIPGNGRLGTGAKTEETLAFGSSSEPLSDQPSPLDLPGDRLRSKSTLSDRS